MRPVLSRRGLPASPSSTGGRADRGLRPSRRALLLGGAGVTVAGLGAVGYGMDRRILPGRVFLQRHLGLDGRPGVIPDVKPGPVQQGSFVSQARGGVRTGWALVLPPGRLPLARLPLVVALHWYGADHQTLLGPQLGLPEYLAAHVEAGRQAFAVAVVDGGTSYWHPHDGEDSGAMVLDELLPLLATRGLHPQAPLGLLGWSMGGYGALRLGGLLGHRRVAAVQATSPALWTDAGAAPDHAFDSAADYERYSVFGHQADLGGLAVRVECGTGDPFYPAVHSYVGGFAHAAVTAVYPQAGHDPGFWRRALPDDLAFLGSHLQFRVAGGAGE